MAPKNTIGLLFYNEFDNTLVVGIGLCTRICGEGELADLTADANISSNRAIARYV